MADPHLAPDLRSVERQTSTELRADLEWDVENTGVPNSAVPRTPEEAQKSIQCRSADNEHLFWGVRSTLYCGASSEQFLYLCAVCCYCEPND